VFFWAPKVTAQAGDVPAPKPRADFGREISVRPFAGVKKITYAAGGTPGPSGFAERITVGVGLYKWF
jgi:hypothetical protein